MNVKQQVEANMGTLVTLAAILPMMFFLFASRADLEAVAQTVDLLACKAAKSTLAQYEAVVLQSGKPPTPLMEDAMIDLQIIIDAKCP